MMENARSGGWILNVSSLFGVIGRPNRHCYTATKSALSGVTRSAGLELPAKGYYERHCSGIYFDDMTKSMLSPERRKSLEEIVPIGRMGNELRLLDFRYLWFLT